MKLFHFIGTNLGRGPWCGLARRFFEPYVSPILFIIKTNERIKESQYDLFAFTRWRPPSSALLSSSIRNRRSHTSQRGVTVCFVGF
jgi:hypothetical protein